MSNELKITKERILKAASECPTVKHTLKTLFPEAFEDDKSEPFDFGGSFTLSAAEGARPLVIATAYAPTDMRGKCLFVNPKYVMETFEFMGYTMLKFFPK